MRVPKTTRRHRAWVEGRVNAAYDSMQIVSLASDTVYSMLHPYWSVFPFQCPVLSIQYSIPLLLFTRFISLSISLRSGGHAAMVSELLSVGSPIEDRRYTRLSNNQ